LLKLHRWPTDDWQGIGAEMPSEIIWADLLNATAEEKQFVERMLKVRVPSEESLSEIEASSRLILEHGTLYLSSPAVRLNEDNEAEITPVGFVIGPHVLVTVRFAELVPGRLCCRDTFSAGQARRPIGRLKGHAAIEHRVGYAAAGKSGLAIAPATRTRTRSALPGR